MTPDTITAPERTDRQRLEALVEANRVRSLRARWKRELAAGRADWTDVLDDPDFATAKVLDVLRHVPKVGRVKAERLLRTARISPSKTVGGLTRRQRADLLLTAARHTGTAHRLSRPARAAADRILAN